MRLPLLISLSLLLCAAQKVCAQLAPADDFFHSGAQFYLSNNIAQAKAAVDTGLKLYPDDEKLKKLDELLKQQQQQQNQQNQKDQQQQQQSQKDQQNQKQQEQQQQKSPEQQKQDQQKQEDQKKADQKKDEQQKPPDQPKPSPGKKDGEKPEDQKGEGQPAAPGQMTPEEAKRLLDAQKGDEQVLQLKPDGKPKDSRKPVKDW
jgi:Ca-activated chloride channel family protein